MNDLDIYARDIAQIRKKIEKKYDDAEELRIMYQRTDPYQAHSELMEDIKKLQKEKTELEDAYRQAVIEIYDGENKHPHPAVHAVQVKRQYVYGKDEMLDFLVRNWGVLKGGYSSALKLGSKTAVDKVAKTVKPDFVQEEEYLTVAIKSDLSMYLEE